LWKNLRVEYEPEHLRNPLLLISLSTSNPQFMLLYSQARELANYLLDKLEFKRFASFYTSAMPPAVSISEDGIAEMVGVHFYHYSLENRDIVLLAGYSSPSSNEYEFVEEILQFASKNLGVRELVSIGARWNEEPIPPLESPKVLGFGTDQEAVKHLENNGVTILRGEPAYYFANTVVGLAPRYGIRGYKLSVNHGEPKPHPRSLMAFLDTLSRAFGIHVDATDLESQAKELANAIKSSQFEQREGIRQRAMGPTTEQQGDIYR